MARILHIELGLKCELMSFADQLSRLHQHSGGKMIPNVLGTNSTHTGIAYALFTCNLVTTYAMYAMHGMLQKTPATTWDGIRHVLTT